MGKVSKICFFRFSTCCLFGFVDERMEKFSFFDFKVAWIFLFSFSEKVSDLLKIVISFCLLVKFVFFSPPSTTAVSIHRPLKMTMLIQQQP